MKAHDRLQQMATAAQLVRVQIKIRNCTHMLSLAATPDEIGRRLLERLIWERKAGKLKKRLWAV